MFVAHIVVSSFGEIIDNVLVELPEGENKCQCELYALTINFNKVFCLKCHKRFKATNRKQNGKRVFVYDSPIRPQTFSQLEHQIVTAKKAETQLVG